MEVWLGNESSYMKLDLYAEQYKFDKEALSRSPFDNDHTPSTDPTFGVKDDRIGLYLLEKVGDTTVIKVHGSLTPTYSRWQSWFPGDVTSYEALKDAFQIVMESGQKKVLMDIASGGGAVRGLDTVTSTMKKARKMGIRVDAHTSSVACSAAYWLMSGARQATAEPMAEVGNIGTMAVVRTYANTEETMGVKFTVIKAGKYKGIGNPYEELTAADQAVLQKSINKSNQFFLDHVAQGRGLDLKDTDSWGEAQTFFAADAVKVGLIDKVTTLDDLIGSGASANQPSDNRRFEMNISAEKRAQIEAGADPKAVLNDAEFEAFTEELRVAAEEVETAKQAAIDAEAERVAAEEALKNPPAAGLNITAEFQAALKENGKLEQRLEAAEGKLTETQAALTKAQADLQSLMVVAQAGVEKLQVALQKPREAKGTPAEVLAQFTDLQSQMSAVFKTSQQSKAADTEDKTKAQVTAITDFRAKQLPAKTSR